MAYNRGLISKEQWLSISALPDDELGHILRQVLNYALLEIEPRNPTEHFLSIRQDVDSKLAHDIDVSERRRDAAKQRWMQMHTKNDANALKKTCKCIDSMQMHMKMDANAYENGCKCINADNPKEKSAKEKDNNIILPYKEQDNNTCVEERKKEKIKKKEFVPPTLDEILAYIKLKGYHFSPRDFYEYYDADDWHYGQGASRTKISNWHRCCATWESLWRKKHPDADGNDLFSQPVITDKVKLFADKYTLTEQAAIIGIDTYVYTTEMNDNMRTVYRERCRDIIEHYMDEHVDGK